MSDYEATAYLSLEKLKEKHNLEIQQLHEKIKSENSAKMQLSKSLMELVSSDSGYRCFSYFKLAEFEEYQRRSCPTNRFVLLRSTHYFSFVRVRGLFPPQRNFTRGSSSCILRSPEIYSEESPWGRLAALQTS